MKWSALILLSYSFTTWGQTPIPPETKNNTPEVSSSIPKNQDKNNQPENEANTILSIGDGLAKRDPFRLPEYIIIKLRQKQAQSITPSAPQAGIIDETVEPIRRWTLPSYQLVGIIWDVKKPKAMFLDRNNSIHVLTVNEFIGNAKGVITSIQSGSVTVLEGRIPQLIKLKK